MGLGRAVENNEGEVEEGQNGITFYIFFLDKHKQTNKTLETDRYVLGLLPYSLLQVAPNFYPPSQHHPSDNSIISQAPWPLHIPALDVQPSG